MHNTPENNEWTSGPYWMVHSMIGGGAPNYKHGTRDGAIKEAKRLAEMNPNEVFTVLEVVAAFGVKKPPITEIQVTELRNRDLVGDGIPF